MKNSKRYIALLLSMVLLVSTMFTSCNEKKGQDDNKADVTPTITIQVTPAPTDSPSENNTSNTFESYEKGKNVLSLDSGDDFDRFLNELYISLISADSFSLHYKIENPEKYKIKSESAFGDVNSIINDEFIQNIQKNLNKFDYGKLSESQKVKYSLLEYELAMFKKMDEDKAPYIYALSQNNNFISNLQQYFTEFPIEEKKDAELYLELLAALPDVIKSETEYIEKLSKAGKGITKEMYDYSLELIDAWSYGKASDCIIYISFENNMKEAELSESDTKDILARMASILDEKVTPAIKEYKTFVEGMKSCIVPAKGAAAFEGGREYYEYLLESYLGTGMTPEQIFDYGTARYTAYFERIGELAKSHPLLVSTIGLTKSKYSDDPMEIMNELAKLAKKELPDVGNPNWIISYLDKRQEVDSISAYYLSPQLDNIGRRVIRVNKSNVSDSLKLFVTLAHEGIPGHLYQDEFNFGKKDFQEIDSALTYLSYQEGWAMYVEKLAYNWCIDNEIKAEILNIDNVVNYVLVALVDIGVNYYGWSLDDTKNWFKKQGLVESAAESIYGIVCSDPALYPAYGIGYLLMEDTVEALHSQGIEYKTCYEKILTVGSSPYSILWKYLGIDPLKDYK